MDKITVKRGEKYLFESKFSPKTVTNLWASVGILTKKGHVQLRSSNGDIFVDGHTELVSFEFPELEPGEYPYVVTIGDPYEIMAKLEGMFVVEDMPKPSVQKPKTSKKLGTTPVTKLKADKNGVFTSDSFFGEENEDGESGSGVEMP